MTCGHDAMTYSRCCLTVPKETPMIDNQRPGMRGFLALVLISMLALAQPPDARAATSESDQHHAQALDYIAKGDWQSALIELKNAVQADPDNAAARFDLGL